MSARGVFIWHKFLAHKMAEIRPGPFKLKCLIYLEIEWIKVAGIMA